MSSHISGNNEFIQVQSSTTRYQVVTRFLQYMQFKSLARYDEIKGLITSMAMLNVCNKH